MKFDLFERIEVLITRKKAAKLEEAIKSITAFLLAEGFNDTEIRQYIESVVGFVVDDTVDPL
jgi:hypothetical protein